MAGTPALRLFLGVAALGLAAGGMWTAASGSGGGSAPPQQSLPAPVASAASPTPGSTPTPLPPPPPTTAAAPTEPPAPTPTPPAATAAPARAAAAPPTPAPTATPTQDPSDQPVYTANAVLDLSRSVRLPNGETFELCSSLGPEGEPWPFAVHLYWAGRNTWVVETHRGDAGLYFDEATATFRVKVVERAGC